MTMHDHDPDLIMALAEDTLAPLSRASAEASVAACSECSAALAMQRAGLRFLREAPSVGMTELESTRMHRALETELGLATESRQIASRRVVNWNRWLAVGAAAAVLVGVVAVAPSLDLIGSGDSGDTAALQESSAGADEETPAGDTADAAVTTAAPSMAMSTAVAYSSDDLPELWERLTEPADPEPAGVQSAEDGATPACGDAHRRSVADSAFVVASQAARYEDQDVELVGYQTDDAPVLVVYESGTCKVITTYTDTD
jgi:hypothetical protein